tara:strand:+ start:16386 stop:19412 length:3027 start_codon:yes stop_codon:yes gene_type:complete
MKATWFENKELITLYTDDRYFGADVPDSYQKRPSKPVPVDSLFGYEPASKMDDIHHKDSMLKIALQMKAGTWDGPPIVVRKDPKGYQVLDGHHRMHAARKAGIDTLDAVIVDREDIEYSDEVKEQQANESYSANEVDALYAEWDHEYPVEYAEFLGKTFGSPDELTKEQAVWHNKDGFKRIVVRDEYILHGSPAPHYDFVYCYIDLEVPEELSDELAECSGSILIDHLKNTVGARCGSLTANATTLNFVLDVVAGRVEPTKEEYEKRILDMKDMFAQDEMYELDWWEDNAGDADPDNPFYAEDLKEASGYIPTAAQANDPRFKTALTVDVRPGEDQRNIEKLGLNLNMDLVNKTKPGKKRKKKTLAESLMEKYQVFKEEDLVEVDMSSSALRSWAKSEMAQGVNAGFELELIFANTERDEDEYSDEANMDYDEPIGNLDDIITFYDGDNYAWESMQPVDDDRFREVVLDDLMEYQSEQFFDWWNDNGEEMVRDEMEREFDRKPTDEEFEEEFENEGELFTRVREDEEDKHRDDITWAQFWEAHQVEAMSDLLLKYDLVWPYQTGSMGGSLPVDSWAEQIAEITGKGVNVSATYHGSDKVAGKYTIEPDSSLTADEGPDSGYELVSPVMPLDEALDQLGKLFDYIEEQDGDIYTNDSTGLHMNISVPQGNDIDYTKLVLFSGDKYILDKYNRLSNNYADSALGQLEARAGQMDANRAAEAMQKMKDNLEDTAEEYVRAGTGQAKYTSIHIKDGYIEFRGPGGRYTDKSFGETMNTMLRFARAMTIAADPQAYRQEYQKKLYKTLSKGGQQERTIDTLFADFQSGDINKEVFKKRWANLVVKQQQDQAILNKLDDRPDDKRLAKAKQLQKDLGGPQKPWKYSIQYKRENGTVDTTYGKVKASTAQLATQAAVQNALDRFDNPQFKTSTPDFNTLKVEIDLPDAQNFRYRVPYTKGDGGIYHYEGDIRAEDADKARDQVINAAKGYFVMNPQFTPNYIDTDIFSLDAAWMR